MTLRQYPVLRLFLLIALLMTPLLWFGACSPAVLTGLTQEETTDDEADPDDDALSDADESLSPVAEEEAAEEGDVVVEGSPAEDSPSEDETPPAEDSVEAPVETGCDLTVSNPFTGTAVDLGSALAAAYEPSDADWHSGRDSLFVVSDEGYLTELSPNGTKLNEWSIGGDLEGVTIPEPDSDFVYVGVENPDAIKEFNIATGSVTRTFTLTTWMTGADNSGLEALTFAADAASAEGGFFYAGHQGEGAVYVFELPITTSASSTAVDFVESFVPASGRTDISGLDFDAASGTLLILYDGANLLRVTDAEGSYLAEWTVPGNDQEGVALTPECDVVIAEDAVGHEVLFYPAP